MDDRSENVLHNPVGQRRGDDRRRRVGSHPAGIRPLVAVKDLLVILRGGQGKNMGAIRQRQKRGLFAAQELLNHDLVAGRAKLTLAHNGGDCGLGFGLGGAQQDAFSSRKTIGFDHNRCPDFFDITAGFVRVTKYTKSRGWHALLLHEFALVKALLPSSWAAARFGPNTRSPRASNRSTIPRLKRQLRADHRQSDPFFFGKRAQPVNIVRSQRNQLGLVGNPGITRRTVDGRDARTLANFPHQGVFPAAAANHQYFHG